MKLGLFVNALYLLVLFMSICDGAWYSAEDKVCDPTGNNWARYTGFRIHRHLVTKSLLPPVDHFVTITKCNDGEVIYERIERTTAEDDIAWDRPICLLKDGLRVTPENNLKRPANRKNYQTNIKKEIPFGAIRMLEDLPKKPHTFNPLRRTKNKPQEIEMDRLIEENPDLVKREARPASIESYLTKHLSFQKAKDKYTSFVTRLLKMGGFIDVGGSTQNKDFEDIIPVDTSSSKEIGDLDDLQCFKFARRKSFSQRKLTLGLPNTFIGGLFLCNVTQLEKLRYLKSLRTQDKNRLPFHFTCDENNARPLLPLLLDNMLDSWYKIEDWGFRQRIPYLYTPSFFDHRFGFPAELLGIKTPGDKQDQQLEDIPGDLKNDQWYKEINVNEVYTLSKEDKFEIEQVGTAVINAYLDLVETMKKNLNVWSYDFDSKEALKQMTPAILEESFLLLLPKLNNTKKAMSYFSSVQAHWDSLNLSKETFNYKLAP